MLVEFTVGNFLSFKEQTTFSMVASSIKELQEKNTFDAKNFSLLKSAVVYGPNASGKSNLFVSLDFMKKLVLESSKEKQINEEIDVRYFKLDKKMEDEPSFFEIVFIIEDIRYRYGFEVNKEKIIEEWLFSAKKNAEKSLFYRVDNDIELDKTFTEGKGLNKKTRKNALFLSVVANFNGEISTKILSWFHKLKIVSGFSDKISNLTKKFLGDPEYKKKIIKMLHIADIDIVDIIIDKFSLDEVEINGEEIPAPILRALKNKEVEVVLTVRNDIDGEKQLFPATQLESAGTIKLLSLSSQIIYAIEKGSTLVIDELDAKFHPLITQFIIEMFNSTRNSKAQLIFNTHDSTLLSKEIFRRDQIWFAEKDNLGCSELYSLVEYKQKVRNDESYNKNYLRGKYGAIPYVGDINLLGELFYNGETEQSEEKTETRRNERL
ncbi:AAA family ATPase [Bacillus altitudinis]|uniref:AAA family ATPase n=1 Tax=Bacillus altitudinis TaxID=293387 RepID=UPI001B827B2B|nr:ATP-binding protein [Bacillus altitudinis]MBR0581316.1 ATP-binding protein [Bacillus altitudinis A23-8]